MNIQKEKEAFEVHIKSTYPMGEQLAKDCEKTLCELYSSEWEAWQAAKAQAIPDGFVLMPMVPSERMIHAVRQCYEGEAYLPYSLYSEFVNQAIIERMEAREPAND